MARIPSQMTIRVVLGNGEAVAAFARAQRLVEEAVEESPWDQTLAEIRDCLSVAEGGLRMRQVRDG